MLKILTVPNPILTKKAEPVKAVDSDVLNLITGMIDACRNAQGIGLAAPQVGKPVRVCIINLEHMGLPPFPLINPKITKKSWKKIEMEEGCLSIPGIFGIVKRPEKIKVKAMNAEGVESEFSADGLLARVIQHEVDHLDGVLFTSKMKRITGSNRTEKL